MNSEYVGMRVRPAYPSPFRRFNPPGLRGSVCAENAEPKAGSILLTNMLRRLGIGRLAGWVALVASVLAVPGIAGAETVFADVDRDGIRDVLSVLGASRSTLQVWISSTQQFRKLHTTRPIYRVAAVDVDGDGRPEIVASDTSAKLHIWRQGKNGRLHRVRARRSAPFRFATAPSVEGSTDSADVPSGGGDVKFSGEPLAPASMRPVRVGVRLVAPNAPVVLDRRYHPTGCRPPPPQA
jgi:hypothetical protein